jgi:hypothetical protein
VKVYWWSRDVAPLILNLGTGWRWVVSFMYRPLYSRGKSPRYPVGRPCGPLDHYLLLEIYFIPVLWLHFPEFTTCRAGLAQRYIAKLRVGWSEVRVPPGAGNFSLHHRVHTGSGVYPASYPMGTRDSFPGGKAAGAWSWPLTSTYCRDQERVELYLHSPNMAWCLIKIKGILPLLLPLPACLMIKRIK